MEDIRDGTILRLAHLVRLFADWTDTASMTIAAEMVVEIGEILDAYGQGRAFDVIDGRGAWETPVANGIGKAIRSVEDTGILDPAPLIRIIEQWRDYYADYPDWHEFSTLPGMRQRTGYHGFRDAVMAAYQKRGH